MPPEPMKNAARRAKSKRTFDPTDCCLLCGIGEVLVSTDPSQLEAIATTTATTPGSFRQRARVVLEEHHLLGRKVDEEFTVPLCRNCHAKLHACLLDIGIDFYDDSSRTALGLVSSVLRILAWFHSQLAHILYWLADRLDALEAALDGYGSGWRGLPEAMA